MKILIVEDDKFLISVYKSKFKNFSYEVSESEIPDIKYNYPILEGSLIDKILQRCEIEIERSNEKVQ